MTKLLFQVYAISMGTLLIFIILLPPSLVALPFSLPTRLKIVIPFWRLFGLGIIKLASLGNYYYLDRREELVQRQTPLIKGLYISNHQSMTDIPLLLTRFQTPPIMKKEVLKIPIFGLLAWASGAIPVDRKDKESRRKVREACEERLKLGISVQVYPEGTRSKNQGKPKDFSQIRIGLIEFAYNNNIPVYPCSTYGTFRMMNLGGKIKPFQKVGLICSAAEHPKDYESKEEFSRACWNKVLMGHQELSKKIEGS